MDKIVGVSACGLTNDRRLSNGIQIFEIWHFWRWLAYIFLVWHIFQIWHILAYFSTAKFLHRQNVDYMAHAVAFAAIKTMKTREHFCGKFLYNAIASTDNAQHKICPSSGIDDRPGRDLFRVLKRSPISPPHTLGLRRDYSDGKAVGNTTGLRRRLHPHWRISLLQSLCQALGQTETSSKARPGRDSNHTNNDLPDMKRVL